MKNTLECLDILEELDFSFCWCLESAFFEALADGFNLSEEVLGIDSVLREVLCCERERDEVEEEDDDEQVEQEDDDRERARFLDKKRGQRFRLR